MTETLLALVPVYGLWMMAVTTVLSCLALPIPASVLMLTAGGFAASGDLVLWQVLAASLAGAVLGDQIGYAIGRHGGGLLVDVVGRKPERAALLARATNLMERRGSIGIFLTRWLFSPLGPWANFAAGSIRFDWRRFTLAGVLGEAIWVGLYVGLGFGFAGNVALATDMIGSILGFLAAGAVTAGLGLWLRHALREARRPAG